VIQVATGGSPPSPTLIEQLTALNMDVTHLYGLTETYGPSVVCEWQPEWDSVGAGEGARLRARQGIANVIGRPLRIIDSQNRDVAEDGDTLGEVLIRGNTVMLGYFKDEEATAAVNVDGWLRTGDLGVIHPDGYVELRDRAKDVIISGGENVTSIEVEQAIASHPAVLEVAVVSKPDPKWGEVPVAFVTLKPGCSASEAELMGHVRLSLAGFKVPKSVIFGELPKNGTGKIQKFLLKQRMWGDTSISTSLGTQGSREARA
jgi:fatty-acyl-CoA synthase